MELKSILLAGSILAGISLPTHATIVCGPAYQTIGKSGTNPVVSTVVWHDGPEWHVVHTLRDGTQVSRENQYTMTDDSNGSTRGWHGWSIKNHDLWMTGEVFAFPNGYARYVETLHDAGHGDVVRVLSETECHRPNSEPMPAPVVPDNPPVVAQNPGSVPLYSDDNGHSQRLMVTLGSETVNMLLDTGASELSVTQSVAYTLVSNGEAIWGPSVEVTLADGSSHMERVILIGRVMLGGLTITRVPASVASEGGMMLLGMGVLRRFGRFTIDVANSQLILG